MRRSSSDTSPVNCHSLSMAALPLLYAIMFCMYPAAATAHLPSLFGKEYIRAEPLADMQSPGTTVPLEIEAGDPGPYEEQLKDMALSEGPYASGLTDPLAGVAQIYKQRGQYDEAIESYRRALHVIRVNDGLKSERQLPLLKDLMAIYRIVGDGQALDDAYHYYFNIHGNGYPPYTEASIAANVEYMAWQREAFGVKIGGKAQSRARAVQAYLRNAQMIEEMAAQTSPNVDWYEDIVMSQMANLYMVMGEDLEEHMSVGMPSGAMYGSELQSEAFVRDRISVIQGTGEKVGRKLIQSLIDMRPEAPATKRAALYLELGDWNQWNGSLRRANEAYTIVETLLLAENEHELLENWLAEPMELPDERALWRSGSGLSREQYPVMTVRYDVSEKGDVRNVSVSQSDASASWPANRLKRLLRETHFRPRFAGGQPLAATNLERNYQVLD
jgi:tetratricopeptide (TPR) repeat protein